MERLAREKRRQEHIIRLGTTGLRQLGLMWKTAFLHETHQEDTCNKAHFSLYL